MRISRSVRRTLKQLTQVEMLLRNCPERSTLEREYAQQLSLIQQREGMVAFITRETNGLIPYWTEQGYRLQPEGGRNGSSS